MKRYLETHLVDTRTNAYFKTSNFLAFVTILSTVSIILETVPSLSGLTSVFVAIEWVSVIIFTAEYVARLYIIKPSTQYIFSFYGLVDLISIAPTWLGLGNLTFLKSARIVRLLRFLRLVRLAKIRHLSVKEIEHAGSVMFLNITIYTVLLLCALLVFGIGMYIVETGNPYFMSIPHGMWWAFQVFVTARPEFETITVLGGVLYVLARFVGLILLGALVGVIGNIFRHYFFDTKKRR